jgi:hypothetical protein
MKCYYVLTLQCQNINFKEKKKQNKIRTQKSGACLHTNSEWSEKEFMKTVSFTIG